MTIQSLQAGGADQISSVCDTDNFCQASGGNRPISAGSCADMGEMKIFCSKGTPPSGLIPAEVACQPVSLFFKAAITTAAPTPAPKDGGAMRVSVSVRWF